MAVDPLGFHAAADADAGLARRLRAPGHAQRGLAECGLGIDPALARDDEVGASETGVEVGRLHDEVDAGPQGEGSEAVLDRQQAEPDATGGAGSRGVALATAGRGLEVVRPGRVAGIEACDLLRRARPSVDRRSAAAPDGPSSGFDTSQAHA